MSCLGTSNKGLIKIYIQDTSINAEFGIPLNHKPVFGFPTLLSQPTGKQSVKGHVRRICAPKWFKQAISKADARKKCIYKNAL